MEETGPLGYRLQEQKMLAGSEESQKVSGKVLLCRNKKALHRYSGHTLLSHAWLKWEFSHHNLKRRLCDPCAYADAATCSYQVTDLTLDHLQAGTVSLGFVLCLLLLLLLLRWTISLARSNGLCQTRAALLRAPVRWL